MEKGEIDLLTSAQKTEERLQRFDFSDKAIGTSAAILTVRAGNTDYVHEDYTNWNGIRVGLLNGSSRNEDFAEFAEKNGFSYSPIYYNNTEDLVVALKRDQANRRDSDQ